MYQARLHRRSHPPVRRRTQGRAVPDHRQEGGGSRRCVSQEERKEAMKHPLGALLGAALLVFVSSSAQAQELPEARRYPPSSVRWKLVAGGLGLTGLAYGASYLSASNWPEV